MIVMAIFGTGTVPNSIWESVIPTQWLTKVKPICTSIRAAYDTTFIVEGAVTIWIGIGRRATTAVFGFAPMLATKTIPGTAFIDIEIKQVEMKNRHVMSNGGRAVAIVESFEGDTTVHPLNDATTRDSESSETSSPTLRLSKNNKIPPRSEAPILVRTTEGGTFMGKSFLHTVDGNILHTARGRIEASQK